MNEPNINTVNKRGIEIINNINISEENDHNFIIKFTKSIQNFIINNYYDILYYLEEFKNFFSKPKKDESKSEEDKSKSSQNEIKQKEEKKKEESKPKPIDTDYEEPPNFKYITIRLKPINEYYFRNKRDARNAAKRAGKGKEPLEQKAHDDGFDYFVNYDST